MKKKLFFSILVLLIFLIIVLVIYVIRPNKPSQIEILCNKFDINITERTKITYFKSEDDGTKARLVINEEEYIEILSELKQSGYRKLESFERISKNINDLSQLPSQYDVFKSNRDWMSVYDVSEVYSVYLNESGKKCKSQIYITDEINGFRELYLLTNR